MIRLIAITGFALGVAPSAEAMSPAPLHEPDAMITQIRKARKARRCDDPNQVRINGICEFDAPYIPPRVSRRCVEWNEGFCVEYYGTHKR